MKIAPELEPIDLEDAPDLGRIVDEVKTTQQPVVIRRNGVDVAIIEPLDAAAKGQLDQPRAIIEREALRRSAGGWDGLVDVEEFRENNRESRRLSSRSPVSL